jgi:integrase
MLTENGVRKLGAGTKRLQLLDTEVRGFGVRVQTIAEGGRKHFYWRAKLNGKSAFKSLGEFPAMSVDEARTEAKKWIGISAAWKQSGYEGPNPFEKVKRVEPASVPLFKDLVEAYIVNHVRVTANKPERAEYRVRWLVRKHLAAWNDRAIDAISVEDMLTAKNARGQRHHLANRLTELVRALFNWSAGMRDGKVNFWKCPNPAVDVSRFPEKPRKRFLSPEELQRFTECVKTEKNRDLKDFLTLALSTGARRGDILSARWQDIEWEREVWQVPFPKNGETYNVQLLPEALAVFKRRRSEAVEGEPHVFPSYGKEGVVTNMRDVWNAFRKRAKLVDFHVHDIRHSCASYLAMAGVPLQQIGEALGHRNLNSTKRYAHLLDDSIRAGREAGQAKMQEMMNLAKKRRIRVVNA